VATVPSRAPLSGTVSWSDSSAFDGYVMLGLVLPQNSDGIWPTVGIEGVFPPQRIPIWTVVPISNGSFDVNTYVFYNTSITPPGTQYVAYWYDLNKRRIFPATGNAPAQFSVTTSPLAIAIPTLTIPTNSGVVPVPADSPTQGI
jgi:hypothetical protein